MRRVMSVWLPNWPIVRLRLGRNPPARPDEPLATVESVDGVRCIAAIDDAAAAHGLHAGQKLADARAIFPPLAVVDADPDAEARALAGLADWAGRFTPAVATDGADGLLLDISGCAHLWGGEAPLAADLLGRLQRRGIPARAAVADSFGAAWAVARFEDGAIPAVVAAGTARARLDPLPVAALGVEAETAAALHRFGLSTIGQLAAVRRADLARRFGPDLLVRFDQALGTAEAPVVFRRPPTPWFERLAFAEPIAAPEDLARVLGRLARALCARLAAAERGGHRFEAAFHRVDDTAVRCAVATALPCHSADRIAKLLAARLESVDPGFGVEIVTLAAERVEPLAPAQDRLRLGGPCETPDALGAVVDTLSNRLGPSRLYRLAPQESHVPERAVRRQPPLASPAGKSWPAERPRPIRLLRRPETIEATAPVPDDPPVQFRWRGVLHAVRRAEGPERIARDWWLAPKPKAREEIDLVRDYYRVEDAAGRRFWIFRVGLYAAERPARWYLHGLFG